MRTMPRYPMVQCLDGRHPPFNIEEHPTGCPAHLAALATTSGVESARLLVHIDQQLNDGLCKHGEDHREGGPCHRIVDIVLGAVR